MLSKKITLSYMLVFTLALGIFVFFGVVIMSYLILMQYSTTKQYNLLIADNDNVCDGPCDKANSEFDETDYTPGRCSKAREVIHSEKNTNPEKCDLTSDNYCKNYAQCSNDGSHKTGCVAIVPQSGDVDRNITCPASCCYQSRAYS